MTPPVPPGFSFTIRSIVAGLAVGTVICAANVYFGLQTGWVSIMSMPASLMGFGIFSLVRRHLHFPFTPIENVFLQSVACGMAIMPLGCGLVGVVPAMEYLMLPDEQGPLLLSMWQLIVWSVGLCYFGVVFAVPLRRQVIIRERLRFPSGFSTAVLISVLHGQGQKTSQAGLDEAAKGGFASLVPDSYDDQIHVSNSSGDGLTVSNARCHDEGDLQDNRAACGELDSPGLAEQHHSGSAEQPSDGKSLWASNMRLLLASFLVSGIYTVCTYFLPVLRNIPLFGTVAAENWLWTLNPSLAYVGQGIIMGVETTTHMTLGAIFGWGILSPLAKAQGWAPGPVNDWEQGSKGWIVWVSLAIMLVDAVVSLAYLALRSLFGERSLRLVVDVKSRILESKLSFLLSWQSSPRYSLLQENPDRDSHSTHEAARERQEALLEDVGADDADGDAPQDQLINNTVVSIGLASSILLCIVAIHLVFGNLVPLYATVIAVFMALLLSIMGVRALGETDLNPVSGISKLAQLFFAVIIPQSHQSSVLINLVAGAVSEAGALQAGDLMQDLKTGHLLGAAPKAQFWGQVIGATAGAVLSSFIYRLYTSVYQIPGDLFQVPTAYVWIFTARLVTGQGLPPMVKEWAIGAAALFAVTTLTRTMSIGKTWRPLIPGGIAVAVGMYNVPSFTLARSIGGLFSWYWVQVLRRSNTPLIILASGFILGEGFLSILNLILQGMQVPHL